MSTTDTVRAAAIAASANVAIPTAPNPEMEALRAQLKAAQETIAAISSDKVVRSEITGSRVYHSSMPFIRVPIMRSPGYCDSVQFIGHRLETDDTAVIAVMEAMIASSYSGFSHAPIEKIGADVLQMTAELKHMSEVHQSKMVAAGQSTS